MTNKLIYSLIFLSAIITNISCTKSDGSSSTNPVDILQSVPNAGSISPADIANFLENQANGIFVFNTSNGFYNQADPSPSLNGYFKPNSVQLGLPLTVGSKSFNPIQSMAYESSYDNDVLTWFDKSTSYTIRYKINNVSKQYTTSLMIPKVLSMDPAQNFDQLNVGKTITWNKDVAHPVSYVIVSLSYDPKFGANLNLPLPASGDATLYKNIILNDDGQYVLTLDDINKFPTGGFITCSIYRGAFAFATDPSTSKSFFLGAYSTIFFGGTVTY